jgi:hypothetical protein
MLYLHYYKYRFSMDYVAQILLGKCSIQVMLISLNKQTSYKAAYKIEADFRLPPPSLPFPTALI